jgi:enoyl-CoA hydratase
MYGPIAVRETKRMATPEPGLSFEQKFMLKDSCYRAVMASEDTQEEPRAFMKKRGAVYRGK